MEKQEKIKSVLTGKNKISLPFTLVSLMPALTLATCALNQWALDFSGNLQRIRQSKSSVIIIITETFPHRSIFEVQPHTRLH